MLFDRVVVLAILLQLVSYNGNCEQVAEGARIRGASKIIGIDTNPNKFSKGKCSLY